jgi:transcriptional regulator with XRE-family HTH domain
MNEKELLAQVGTGIRAWRKKAGLTLNQLAELADIDVGFLGYIETGKKAPSIVTAAKLAKALNLPLADLFRAVPHAVETDALVQQQLKSLLHGRTAGERADLLVILKQLQDPERVKALRRFIRK